MVPTVGGTAWRCLRCGAFVPEGQPGTEHGRGPAEDAPLLRRGKELRDELILRVFAVERFIRFAVFAAAAYGVWRFKSDRGHIQQAFNHDLPAIRELYQDLGFNFDHSKLIGQIQHSFTLDARTLTYLAIGLVLYSLIKLAEGVGLWLGQRWGEYLAMVATSVFLPYEAYDLTVKITWLRVGALVINLVLVAYLVWSKRLFGARAASGPTRRGCAPIPSSKWSRPPWPPPGWPRGRPYPPSSRPYPPSSRPYPPSARRCSARSAPPGRYLRATPLAPPRGSAAPPAPGGGPRP